ncbi:hypothetical protein VPH35_073022 [Triticum aestivum]
MVVHGEGEIMETEQDPTMEFSKVSMDLTVLHCPLCLCPLTPPVYECKGGHLACAVCRVERPGNQRQCQKCKCDSGFDMQNTAVDFVLSSLQVPLSEPRLLLFAEEDGRVFFLVGSVLDIGAPIAVLVVCIRAGASPLPHYVAKLWANGPPGEPKGMNDAIKGEMEVTSSKDPGDIDVHELTFFTVPLKLLVGAKMVSLHIQIDKLTS